MGRKAITILVSIGIPLGMMLMVFGGMMVIPAAWGAGGGDMPPGRGDPRTMQVDRVMLYAAFGIAIIGAAMQIASLIGGIVLLLTRTPSRSSHVTPWPLPPAGGFPGAER